MNEKKQNILAKEIQRAVPLVSRPYKLLGEKVSETESEVISQVKLWKEKGVLREISGVMEGSLLNYDSALVCGKVSDSKIAAVAEIISSHPTVTHNYRRNHDYNLWFTIAVPKVQGLENHLQILEGLTGITPLFPLRRTHTFKIGVVFDLDSKTNQTQGAALTSNASLLQPSKREKMTIRALQSDLPLCERPFKKLAENFKLTEDELLSFACSHVGGALRRYVGTLRHRKLGVRANGMTVWNIPTGEIEKMGLKLMKCPEVSHCYARSTLPDFPYSLYSMLHGPDSDHLRMTAKKLSNELRCSDYLVLESTEEYKKCRLRYFLPELDKWWLIRSAEQP